MLDTIDDYHSKMVTQKKIDQNLLSQEYNNHKSKTLTHFNNNNQSITDNDSKFETPIIMKTSDVKSINNNFIEPIMLKQNNDEQFPHNNFEPVVIKKENSYYYPNDNYGYYSPNEEQIYSPKYTSRNPYHPSYDKQVFKNVDVDLNRNDKNVKFCIN